MFFKRDQIIKFHALFISLLEYVNYQTKTLHPEVFINMVENRDNNAENKLRMVLWNNPVLIDDFVAENPANLNPDLLITISNWRNFRFGDFLLCKVVRGVGIFLAQDSSPDYFAVYPLRTPFKELVPDIPSVVRTALIPYEGVIVYDGSVATYMVKFGAGLRREISDWCKNAEELGIIKTSLSDSPPSLDQQTAQLEKTNKSVLRNFKYFLRKKSLSDKIIKRDLETVQSLADFMVREIDATDTLRDISMACFDLFMASFEGDIPRVTVVGLKRFFTFMIETNRMDWDLANAILILLRSL